MKEEPPSEFIVRVEARLREQGVSKDDPDYERKSMMAALDEPWGYPDGYPDGWCEPPCNEDHVHRWAGGPFINPETGQEYWPGELGDPYLRRNLDEEAECLEPKKPKGAHNEMSSRRDHYDRSPLVGDNLQETLDSLVDEGFIEVIGTRRDRPVYRVTIAGLTALRELDDLEA